MLDVTVTFPLNEMMTVLDEGLGCATTRVKELSLQSYLHVHFDLFPGYSYLLRIKLISFSPVASYSQLIGLGLLGSPQQFM